MKTNNIFLSVTVIIGAIALLICAVFLLPKMTGVQGGPNQQVACTMEAMMCPDGSAVGRTGPKCEFAACPNTPTPMAAEFGSPVDFTIGKTITMPDFSDVTLLQINDSRCKSGVVCIWAGELSPVFSVNGFGNEASQSMQITLGTTTAPQLTKNGYTFVLNNATETSATITITTFSPVAGNCYVGGCSGEICSDAPDMVSTCIYKEQYACYKTATCARQSNGQCGWTQTPTLVACLGAS